MCTFRSMHVLFVLFCYSVLFHPLVSFNSGSCSDQSGEDFLVLLVDLSLFHAFLDLEYCAVVLGEGFCYIEKFAL